MKKLILIIALFFLTETTFAAMNEATCATLIIAEIKKENPSADDARLLPFWTAICKGLIDHMKTSAVILPTSLLDAEGRPLSGTGNIQ